MMSEVKDLVGQRFGFLTVLTRGESANGKARWICKCDCGELTIVNGYKLRIGETRSCGCLRKSKLSKMAKTHGEGETHLYSVWTNMKTRCTNTSFNEYERYGGRGISYCKEWEKYENFRDWAKNNGYSDEKTEKGRAKLTIDRIDNNAGYYPENCRWATAKEQARNKSNNAKYEYHGVMYCLSELAEFSKVSKETLVSRIKKGFTVEEAVETPSKTNKGRKNVYGQ